MTQEFIAWLEQTGLADPNFELIDQFEDALYAANEVKNLTRVPRAEAWFRHWLDSLLWQDLIPRSSKVLDIGTGPGLPAWPLAWARPDLEVTAIDSNGKMLEFLRAQPRPNLQVVLARAEEWRANSPFDVVTGRALAPIAIQLELSAAHAAVGGRIIPMRTAKDRAEIESFPASLLRLELVDIVERELPGANAMRVFPVYLKRAPTPRAYPRRWADMRSRPLGT